MGTSWILQHFLTITLLLAVLDACIRKPKKEVQLVWVAIAVAVVSIASRWIIPLFRRRTYTSGAYALGEIYRRNVLGESIATRDDRVVGDEAVYLARNIFTAGFGIFIGSNTDLDLVRDGNWPAYRDKMKKENPKYFPFLTQAQFERAVILKKTYFPYQRNPPPARWDLTNFGRLPYLGKIPDVENPGEWMTAELPGGVFLADGQFINPTTAQRELITAIQNGQELPADWEKMLGTGQLNDGTTQTAAPGSVQTASKTNWLLYGGLAVGGFLLYKNRNKLK